MSSWADGYVADVGYTFGYYRELAPAGLALAGLSAGISVPSASKGGTYCELGCGQGFTANILAAANPHIQFYANDFNPSHVVNARGLANSANLANVHFFEDSFSEFLNNSELPMFDYISLHGIYSWVSAEQRDHINNFISRKLRPGGVVYISYNAMPGWAAAAPMRHMMYLFSKGVSGPTADSVLPSIGFVEQLKDVNALYFTQNPVLPSRLENLKKFNANYLAHEYMNDAWTLFYHSEVAMALSKSKLTYLASASLLEHVLPLQMTPAQLELFNSIKDKTMRETVRDFITNTQFRRDIFVKGAVPLTYGELELKWMSARFALSTHRDDIPMTIKVPVGEGALQAESYLPVLEALAEGPKSVRNLLDVPKIASRGFIDVKQSLLVLVGLGHVQPCLEEETQESRIGNVHALNLEVLNRSRHSLDYGYLASPITGGGIAADRLSQLFLLARKIGHPDPVSFAWSLLSSQGQKIMKNGTPIEAAEDNIKELSVRYGAFLRKQMPLFDSLLI